MSSSQSQRQSSTSGGLRLMAVHAHPDDESSKGAATVAKLVAAGVDVTVVTCTGGERGEVLNPAMDRPEVWANLAEIRRAEMDHARVLLGFRQRWLGFTDSGMSDDDVAAGSFAATSLGRAAEPLVRLVRELKPHVMTTYNELGGYPHPDHIMCHRISVEAFEAAGDPTRYPDAGPPWQPLKLYYHVNFIRKRTLALHEGMIAAGLPSPYGELIAGWDCAEPDNFDRITTRVECAEYFELRDEALRAHATQIDPNGSWFEVPLAIQRDLWPTEDYQLARSLVDSTVPEDDLFEGITTRVAA